MKTWESAPNTNPITRGDDLSKERFQLDLIRLPGSLNFRRARPAAHPAPQRIRNSVSGNWEIWKSLPLHL